MLMDDGPSFANKGCGWRAILRNIIQFKIIKELLRMAGKNSSLYPLKPAFQNYAAGIMPDPMP
jgi:hypothetical protein